jgi:hypothetical protein
VPDRSPPPGTPALARRLLVGFGRFWWDFLIGETPELFIGSVVVVGLVALVCVDHTLRTAAAVILPLLVVAVLGASVWKASRSRPPS